MLFTQLFVDHLLDLIEAGGTVEKFIGDAVMAVYGLERSFEQDPKYPIRLLVDIAIKALSPAINDPTTGRSTIAYNGLTTTFASSYSDEISLDQALDLDVMRTYAQQATGQKYLVRPQL